MLFATKTNAGLVVDTKPPEVSVDIGRYEGLLAPTYEAGKTPPVMASFRWDSEKGFLSNYLGSAFTTGDAAVAMSRLYNTKDEEGINSGSPKVWDKTKVNWRDSERKFDSGVDLYLGPPKMPWFVPKEEPGAVRPVLFVTDTGFGFKASWQNPESAATGMPDYFRLAYQRRELAFAGVTVGPDDEYARKAANGEANPGLAVLVARAPSLLGTVDANVQMGEFLNSGFGYLQYFASGSAATALAMREGVRSAMLHRLDPKQDNAKFRTVDGRPETKEHVKCILGWIKDAPNDAASEERAGAVKQLSGTQDANIWLHGEATEEQLCGFMKEKKIECPAANCPD